MQARAANISGSSANRLLHNPKYLSSRPPGRVTIYGDSNLAINQLNGKCVSDADLVSRAPHLSIDDADVDDCEILPQMIGLFQ